MDEYNIIIIAFSIILFLVSIILFRRSLGAVEDFLNLQTNISIIATNDSTIFINRSGLKFFGFDTIKDFQKEVKSINRLFLEEDSCVSRYSHGKRKVWAWGGKDFLLRLKARKVIVVKI